MGSVSGAGASESHPLHLGQMNQSPSSLSVPYVLDLQEDCIVLTFQRIDRVKARGLQTSDVVRKAIGLHARAAKVVKTRFGLIKYGLPCTLQVITSTKIIFLLE